jgi:hypothetical protein
MTPALDDQISVVEAQTTLESAQSAAINLGIARAQYEHAIAMLIGKPASTFSIPVEPKTSAPPPIPVGLPSQLLERRPDVAAAERKHGRRECADRGCLCSLLSCSDALSHGGVESSAIKNPLDGPAASGLSAHRSQRPSMMAACAARL